ncbi:outer dense fiber protein 2-like [Synchiropus splendidus]|uniref:outer dense fiber protein 2-like n=1 Tax=Synchiropus splendidus TaxID=270530 RepID=UPI00237E1BA4|nr:outer dense fiber protein 2-like [Synchiropus splendidus]
MNGRNTPPPLHVHITDTTPVHVHMRRSPGRNSQSPSKEVQLQGKGCRSKGRAPWIPPGKSSTRRDLHSQRAVQHGGAEGRQAAPLDPDDFSQNLTILLKEQDADRLARSVEHGETDALLRALVEAEIDGVAVTSQVVALKEVVDHLRKEKRLSKVQAASLERQRQALLEKIQMFHHTNRGLRDLLRGRTQHQRAMLAWSEENEDLKRRLMDCEAENMRLSAKLSSREKEVGALARHLDLEKDNIKTSEELSRLLESKQDRLDSQLTWTEAEKVRLTAQIQVMQQKFEQQQQELQRLQEELKNQKCDKEQENQELLSTINRQMEEAEESCRQLRVRLQEKEAQLVQARSKSNDWCLRHSREAAAREKLQEDAAALRHQVTELSQKLQQNEEARRADKEEVQRLTADICRFNTDNRELQDQLSLSQEKLRSLRSEAGALRSTVRMNQNLLDKYKKKVQQVRLQSEEFCLKLEETQKEALEEKERLQREKEQLRRDLSARLRELEPLPDKLRRTEEQLKDAQKEAEGHQRRNQEHSCSLAEVRHKVEQQGAELEVSLRRSSLLQQEKNLLKEKTHDMKRKLEELTLQNQVMSESLADRDAAIRSVQQQLEEKSMECSVLTRQLQRALDDAQRQVEESVQRIQSKEKASHVKALDLQGQLSRARTELGQVQRSKEETERRLQNQLQHLRERLEQSDSTNRSLSNYVHFLKTSCAPLVTST